MNNGIISIFASLDYEVVSNQLKIKEETLKIDKVEYTKYEDPRALLRMCSLEDSNNSDIHFVSSNGDAYSFYHDNRTNKKIILVCRMIHTPERVAALFYVPKEFKDIIVKELSKICNDKMIKMHYTIAEYFVKNSYLYRLRFSSDYEEVVLEPNTQKYDDLRKETECLIG